MNINNSETQKSEKKADGAICLAMRSGNLKSGEDMVSESISNGKAKLVIVAKDASDNTKKKFRNSCDYYGVDYVEYKTKSELGHLLGKDIRAVVCILDKGFKELFINNL